MISCTKVIQSRLSVGCTCKTVLWTFAVAGKQPFALPALGGERLLLHQSEGLLPFSVHHPVSYTHLYQYKGNYSYYLEKRQERIEAKTVEIERANNLYRTELEWMRRMPQARGHKARYREDAFYELEKVAKQRFNNDNVKLDVKASYIGSKIFEADHLYKSFGDLKMCIRDSCNGCQCQW